MSFKPLPIGIDNFEKIITEDYFYVDKSLLIKSLIDKKGEVNVFTRPRRFGKTLNLSMLRYFFEKPLDGKSRKHLFEGLKIMEQGEKYSSEQEQYPVIFLTLKSAKQPNWEISLKMLYREICSEFNRHEDILKDSRMEKYAERYRRIKSEKGEAADYVDSIKFLSECLFEYYGKKTIILIDEYDVPLENAYYEKFYDQMVSFIRSLFESALKTNENLAFSVLTGCLRISKESIFTGLNNLNVISILNKDYDEHFGFVEEEVRDMLSFYNRDRQMATMKEWYDGYRFGNAEVYNPWSVINYVNSLMTDENAFPTAAWSNTSSNSIVKDLIYRADESVRGEIEALTNGETIEKKVHEDITYDDIYATQENLWNFLFFTGYLKQVSMRMENDDRFVMLAIPNKEVSSIYRNQISNWFREKVKLQNLSELYNAMLSGNPETFELELAEQLRKTISCMDSREAFYHGFLLGLMANLKTYIIKSNLDSGLGRFDICIRSNNENIPPVILELKLAKKYKELSEVCDTALLQIREKHYTDALEEDGYKEAICYGIGFFRKRVMVKMERVTL